MYMFTFWLLSKCTKCILFLPHSSTKISSTRETKIYFKSFKFPLAMHFGLHIFLFQSTQFTVWIPHYMLKLFAIANYLWGTAGHRPDTPATVRCRQTNRAVHSRWCRPAQAPTRVACHTTQLSQAHPRTQPSCSPNYTRTRHFIWISYSSFFSFRD